MREESLAAALTACNAAAALEAAADPAAVLGDGPALLGRASLEASGRIPLLTDRMARLSGTMELRAEVLAAGAPPELFGVSALPALPEGAVAVVLEAASGASLGPVRRIPVRGPWLFAGGGAQASMTYRRLLVLPAETRRRAAVRRLVEGSELPWAVDPGALAEGEAHRFSTAMKLALGIDFELGWTALAPPLETLLDELSGEGAADFETVLSAAFGLSLTEELDVTVGRALTVAPGRVRVRVSRTREHELSWGARFSLQATFAAGTPLQLLLDRVLGRPGWRELATALAGAGEIGCIAGAVAAGRWDDVAGRLGGEAADAVFALAEAAGVVAGGDGVARFTGLLGEVQRLAVVFSEVAGEVQGVWDGEMVRLSLAEGAPLAAALDRLAAVLDRLGADGVDGVIGELLDGETLRWAGVVRLLETLSGCSVDELLLGGEEAAEALARAAALVGEAVAFREALAALPAEAARTLEEALGSVGLGGVVEAVAAAEDLEALRSLASGRAASLVRRLVGRAVAAADEADLARVRGWAVRMRDLLADADVAASLRALLARLDGRVGVSLALEVDRLTRTGALLDVELEAGSRLARRVTADLAAGDLRGALDRLFAAPDGEGAEGFLLHDCVFTSRRTALASANLLLSLLGWEEDRTRAVTERWLRVRGAPEPERRARTSGGVVRFVKDPSRQSAEGTVWLTLRASGGGGDVARPYDPLTLAAELRLAYTVIAPRVGEEATAALAAFLASVGFAPPPEGPLETLILPGESVRAGFSIRLGEAAVRGLLAGLDEGEWDADVAEAARRWFSEGLVPLRVPHRRELRLGDALAALVASPALRPRPGEELQALEARLAGRRVAVTLEDVDGRRRVLRDVLVPRRTGAALLPAPPYTPALTVLGEPRRARRGMAEMAGPLGRLLDGAATVDDASMAAAVSGFVAAWRRASNHHWPSPTLLLWLVLAHLERVAPAALEGARGTATVRWRGPGEEAWRGTTTLVLDGGVPRGTPAGAAGTGPGRGRRAILERR